MKSPFSPDMNDLRERIIAELNIGHLTADEQEKVINAVGQVLLKRATLAVMDKMPKDTLDELDRLADTGDEAGIQALVKKHVPNAEEIVTEAAREGIAEHKRLVTELVTQA